MPVSARNARAKLRSLMYARAASAGTERSAAGCSAMWAWTSRSGSRRGGAGGGRAGVLGDVGLDVAQRLAAGGPGGELRAELRLPAGPADEEHERARGLERGVRSVVFFDQCKGEIHARRDARRGEDLPVAHVDRVRFDRDLRILRGEPAALRPVRRRPAPVEQARFGKQEGTRADGGD